MKLPDVQVLHELSKAMVAANDDEAAMASLARYQAGEITFEELMSEIQALEGCRH